MPMWGGFAGPMGARMAGRLGLGLLTLEHGLLHDYTAGLSAGGHSLSTARMGGQVEFFITEDPERTWAEIGNHVAYRWRSYNRYLFEGTSREGNRSRHIDMAEIRERFLLGTPAQLAAAIRARVAGLPVTDLYVWSDYPGISDELIDQHIQRTFTELAPLLRAP
jgi:alkanesulfonate monooxygenase SsuD/methylene tetrahydromethanopterin reductase-like flavin-dependent oxidoreductase (luciferase family)